MVSTCCSQNDYLIYTLLAFGLNLPPIVLTFVSLTTQHLNKGECNAILGKWLLVNSILCTINILASFYISSRMMDRQEAMIKNNTSSATGEEKDNASDTETGDSEANLDAEVIREERMTSRCLQFFIDDPWTVLFGFFLVFFCYWLVGGGLELFNAKNAVSQGDNECKTPIIANTMVSVTSGFLFVLFSFIGSMFYLCGQDVKHQK